MSVLLAALGSAHAQSPGAERIDSATAERLRADSGGAVEIEVHRGTGAARFIRFRPASTLVLSGTSNEQRAADFLERYGSVFGIRQVDEELSRPTSTTDRYGFEHLTYRQLQQDLPVFGAALRAHFDSAGRLTAVHGIIVPEIRVDPRPRIDSERAGRIAVREVKRSLSSPPAGELTDRATRLVVFRQGLIQGVPGEDHLTWLVEVGNGDDVREFVFVEARWGKVVERITGIHEIERTITESTVNGPVLWNEGDTLPYDSGDSVNDDQVNRLIDVAAQVYDLYTKLSGGSHLSWNGLDGTMYTVWKTTTLNCPNASWNGVSTNYCDGSAADDVVAHEWTHAYTEATHGLIYQWQPGALNESYSDIFGEIVDFLNGTGTDAPAPTRSAGDCSAFGGTAPPLTQIHTPASIAGDYSVAGASFNPAGPVSVTAEVQLVDDRTDTVTDACEPLQGFTPGRIALIDRGTCSFVSKVQEAQAAGATAVIVVNSDDSVFNMGGSGATAIPAVMFGSSDGEALKANLASGVSATIELAGSDAPSVRWLTGEDAFGFGGAIRDLWNPVCFGDPGKVSDGEYRCSTADSGGVHTNSGVPNHAFALLVDGGTYNGRTVAPIGLTRAAHLYWRAMSVYQMPATDFADHADSLIQSCIDLVGIDLADLLTGAPTGVSFSVSDCDAVQEATLAVEFDLEPACDFQPVLAPDPPPLSCGTASFSEDFETDPAGRWTFDNVGVYAEYQPRDWAWVSELPAERGGHALFALSDRELGDCQEGRDDQSGQMFADSPPIVLGASPVVVFEHYVATEARFDGGNLKISVNGGPWLSVPSSSFQFNAYNDTLEAGDNTNPLAGEEAFTGSDGGEVIGTWGQSRVDLSSFAGGGDTVRLRLDFGVDGCNGLDGWYVDDLLVCGSNPTAGHVPTGADGQAPLRLSRAPGDEIALSWSPSCHPGDQDYAIYEGTIGDFASHASRACGTGGATSATLPPAAGNTYYLVVPLNATREGSYGTDGNGVERLQGSGPCGAQVLTDSPTCD